ncbi:MAG: type II toxin-antitoxin system VapC family toxin [Candidatus Dormibacteraceae bacterium]
MIVVDSGVVIDALLGLDANDSLRIRLAGEEWHAPQLLDVEVVSIARGLVIGRRISAPRGVDLLNDFDDLRIARWPFTSAARLRALELRVTLSAYDAAYVTLAEGLACPLVTRDARLSRSTGHGATIELI